MYKYPGSNKKCQLVYRIKVLKEAKNLKVQGSHTDNIQLKNPVLAENKTAVLSEMALLCP